MESKKQLSGENSICVGECRYPIEESGISNAKKYHAVSLSGGKKLLLASKDMVKIIDNTLKKLLFFRSFSYDF